MAGRQIVNRGSFVRGRGPRRLVSWDLRGSATSVAVPASSAVLVLVFPSATIDLLAPATLIRTRGLVSIATDQIIASETQVGAFGIGFVNTVAGALGITGMPSPIMDSSWEGWFVWQALHAQFEFVTGAGFEHNVMTTFEIDSKAMRKFDTDEALAYIVENRGTRGFNISVDLRHLVKRH